MRLSRRFTGKGSGEDDRTNPTLCCGVDWWVGGIFSDYDDGSTGVAVLAWRSE